MEKRVKDPLRILTTLNANYLPQLQILLTSIFVSNPFERFEVFLLHGGIAEPAMAPLKLQCANLHYGLRDIRVEPTLLKDAPVTQRYPQEMYYRLLAARLLPKEIDRILYLDPDILVINALRPLWETDMRGMLFAAASHTGITKIANNVNRLRLGTECDYFNSGVLLMDVRACREAVSPEMVIAYASRHRAELLLPDQDILNALYGGRILPLDDFIWNYDARYYSKYLLRSSGQADTNWVLTHTAILHFCGRAKPWKPGYHYRFGLLYRHYMHLTRQYFADPAAAPLQATGENRP